MSPRVAASLVLVATGVAVGAAGPSVVVDAAGYAWAHVGVILIVAGGLALVLAVVPRGAAVGPLVLLVLGLGVFVVQTGRIAPASLGALVLVGAGVLFALDLPRWRSPDMNRRRWAVLVPREIRPRAVPGRVRLVALGTSLLADLRGIAVDDVVEVFVSVWLGRVHLVVPPDWRVVAGRLSATRGVRFRGELATRGDYPDPTGADADALTGLRADDHTVGVVHVLGLGGHVDVESRSST